MSEDEGRIQLSLQPIIKMQIWNISKNDSNTFQSNGFTMFIQL